MAELELVISIRPLEPCRRNWAAASWLLSHVPRIFTLRQASRSSSGIWWKGWPARYRPALQHTMSSGPNWATPDGVLYLGAVGDVAGDKDGLAALLHDQLIGGGLVVLKAHGAGVAGAVGADHAGPLPGEAQGHGAAHAGAGPGDERNLMFQSVHHFPSLSIGLLNMRRPISTITAKAEPMASRARIQTTGSCLG